KVDEKIREIAEQNEKIADSSKLAVLTALAYAAELAREKEARETERLFFERKVEELSQTLESALAAAGAAP
ncbi:MAG: cell division protein ZapA, partial [Elusimicrobia bacterium]|nr:cell division protein ZapA [Elusimicrobiota bacterium]